MTSISGAHRQPSLPGAQVATIRNGVIAAAKSKGASGLAGLMTRFTADSTPRPGAQALEAGRIQLAYPEPRRDSVGPSRQTARMTALQSRFSGIESVREEMRNDRQMASTSFQNFDQKANQLMNLLSSVMKSMNEMRMGTVRNMM